jgi:high-affinity nickel-transport protein
VPPVVSVPKTNAPPPGASLARSTAAGGLTPGERATLAFLYAAIALATLVLFVLLYGIGQAPDYRAFAAVGLLAYVLGLRHGVDADHIAAIDNTTRKLLQDGERPLTVGTWFSLGHSTIVVALVVALVAAADAIESRLPALRSAGFLVGTTVSGLFLFLIGLVNLVIVLEIYRIFRGLRQGRFRPAELEEQLVRRGFLSRYFGGLFRLIRKPRHIYPVGVLFGLGFDTATEILLIGLAVAFGTSGPHVPLAYVLVLPALFTAGMVLVDTSQGIGMRLAYGWAFVKPVRTIYYNLTITIISVLVAFLIGGFEVLQLLAAELGLSGGVWSALATLNFEDLGFGVVAVFVAAWLVALAYYRYKRFEETTPAPPSAPGAAG